MTMMSDPVPGPVLMPGVLPVVRGLLFSSVHVVPHKPLDGMEYLSDKSYDLYKEGLN